MTESTIQIAAFDIGMTTGVAVGIGRVDILPSIQETYAAIQPHDLPMYHDEEFTPRCLVIEYPIFHPYYTHGVDRLRRVVNDWDQWFQHLAATSPDLVILEARPSQWKIPPIEEAIRQLRLKIDHSDRVVTSHERDAIGILAWASKYRLPEFAS